MIKSKSDYLFYLQEDKKANGWNKTTFKNMCKESLLPNYLKRWQLQLRKVEYYKNCKRGLLSKIMYLFILRRYYRLSRINGFTISVNCFGPGLSIAHSGTIIVNSKAQVGSYCRLHVGVNIGTAKDTTNQVPHIGNNVYIGPGAKLFGAIEIADNCTIGANAVVNKSFTEKGTKILGIPAKAY